MNIYGVPTNLVVKWILEREGVKSWLDVACGGGGVLELIGFTPDEGLGVDICPAPQLPKGFMFEQADITKWTTDKHYDLVSMFQIVEHIEKDTSISLIN